MGKNMTPNFIIKPLEVVDKKIVENINSLFFQLNKKNKKNLSEQRLKKVISFPSSHFLIAKNNEGKIIGMLVLICYPKISMTNVGWIEDVVVDEKYRGQGIGEALINKALDLARADRVEKISLTSRPSRKAANHLYRKLGFSKIVSNYYRIDLVHKKTQSNDLALSEKNQD